MITFRHMAVAFIEYDNKYLMQKRVPNKKIAGGVYAPVGGHLKEDEFQNPIDACLREVEEETGLEPEALLNIKLKYIIMRRKDHEIRVQYMYFMTTNKNDVIPNEEGTLHWLSSSELLEVQTTFTTHEVIKHYLTTCTYEDPVFVGTVDQEPTLHFVKIEDFEHPLFK